MKQTTLRVGQLDPRPNNPNHMAPQVFDMLVLAIGRLGFLQPVLVEPGPAHGRYTIVDGEHRWRAAGQLGMADVPCVVVPKGTTQEDMRAMRIGMNRLRGELDLAQVAAEMAALQDAGWSATDLNVLGFDEREVERMLAAYGGADDETEAAMAGAGALPEEKPLPKPFVLELTFGNRDDVRTAKKALRHAGGGDMATGLLRLIDAAEEA
jgi:ParB-like chromosome segregation protein Spo0J